jgi:hypothetical protein
MIVALVFVSFAGVLGIMQQVKSIRRQQGLNENEVKLKDHIEQLEERVRTLERIATDSKTTLKEEIETL